MTVVMPAGVAVARDLVGPATEAAINRLSPGVRRVAAYHYGLADAEGNPVRVGSGKALRPALALLSARAAGVSAERGVMRRGRGRARAQLLAAARRHHGRRHRAAAPPDRVDGVRRRRGDPGRRRAPGARQRAGARGHRAGRPVGGPLPVDRGPAADHRAERGPRVRVARRRDPARVRRDGGRQDRRADGLRLHDRRGPRRRVARARDGPGRVRRSRRPGVPAHRRPARHLGGDRGDRQAGHAPTCAPARSRSRWWPR